MNLENNTVKLVNKGCPIQNKRNFLFCHALALFWYLNCFKEEVFEEDKATPIQDYSEVYIKQGEFGALEYQNEKENERVDLEIKGEPINPFVEYEENQESNHSELLRKYFP